MTVYIHDKKRKRGKLIALLHFFTYILDFFIDLNYLFIFKKITQCENFNLRTKPKY